MSALCPPGIGDGVGLVHLFLGGLMVGVGAAAIGGQELLVGAKPHDGAPRLAAVIERGIRENVAIAKCIKAVFIARGGYDPTTFREIPALLAGYRFDECPMKTGLLGILYKYGLGVDTDPVRARHYFRKLVLFAGYRSDVADFNVTSMFGEDSAYDIRADLDAEGRWLHLEFANWPGERKIALVDRYLSGDGVLQDVDVGFRLMLTFQGKDHSVGSAYRLAEAIESDAFSFATLEKTSIEHLIYRAAIDSHAAARKKLGLQLLAVANGDQKRLLHAYAYLLAAKFAGAEGVDEKLKDIAARLSDPALNSKARALLDPWRLRWLSSY